MRKRLAVLISSAVIILAACLPGVRYYMTHSAGNRIISFEIPPFRNEIEVQEGEKSEDNFIEVIYRNGFSASDISIVSENEETAAVKYTFTDRNRYVCFCVTGVSAGETEIFFVCEKDGVSSEKIKVRVLPESSPGAYAPAVTENDENSGEVSADKNDRNVPEGNYVWVAPTGKRYHYTKSCAGKNGMKVKKTSAIADGKTPCRKCAGG